MKQSNRKRRQIADRERYRRLRNVPEFKEKRKQAYFAYKTKDIEKYRRLARERAKKYRSKLTGEKLKRSKAKAAKWMKRNRAKLRDREREKYRANPQRKLAAIKRWYGSHWAAYYKKNRMRLLKKSRRRRSQKSGDFWMEYHRLWRLKNPEKTREKEKRFRKTPKYAAASKAASAKRRALKAGVGIAQLKAIKAFYRSVTTSERMACHWCKSPVPKEHRHVDHVIPLSRGGKHVRRNLVCACKRCNLLKSAKPAKKFLRQLASILNHS